MSAPVIGYAPVLHKKCIRWNKAFIAPSAVEILVIIITTFWPMRVCVNDQKCGTFSSFITIISLVLSSLLEVEAV